MDARHEDRSEDRIAAALCRILVTGEVLSPAAQTRALELEGTAKSKMKFGREVVPRTRRLLREVFGYELVEMDGSLMALNYLPDSIKALKYSFCAKQTQLMGDGASLKQFLAPRDEGPTIYGYGLPRPLDQTVGEGFILLVLFLLVIYGNRILQSELEEILTDQFGLVHYPVSFKDLETQMYIARHVTSDSGGVSKRRSKDPVDPSLIVVELGKRALQEWDRENMHRLFATVFSGIWSEQMDIRCQASLDRVFPA